MIDGAVRSELGRYKTSKAYQRFRHNERHLANSSFTFGMVISIAEKLNAMKAARDTANETSGRALVVLKSAVVDAEMKKLNLNLRSARAPTRLISETAFEAGEAAGASLAINPAVK